MKNTPADFEHAAELLAENTRLRAALAERARQHEAALADIEKAQTDIGRLRIWHERALDERDELRARLSALGKPASEPRKVQIEVSTHVEEDSHGNLWNTASLRPIDAEEVRLMRRLCACTDARVRLEEQPLSEEREDAITEAATHEVLALDALRRHRERTRAESGGEG